MPMRTMLKARAGEAGRVREHAHLPGDFAGGEVADEAHLAREAERAAHRAADLRRDAERLRRRVRDVHGFDVAAVGQLEEELRRAVRRLCRASIVGRG